MSDIDTTTRSRSSPTESGGGVSSSGPRPPAPARSSQPPPGTSHPPRQRRRRSNRHRGGPPDILYHATSTRRVERVVNKGMLEVRGGRPVFLSRHEAQAWHVAHRQNSDPVVLYIDASRARRDGCRFERNTQGLWQVTSVPIRHVLNLRAGFAEQVSAGGIPIWVGPNGPELALIQVQRRSGTTWEVAKGKLEPGESPRSAGVREVQEEMGCPLDLTPTHDLGFIRYGFQTPDGSPRLKTLHMYLMRTPERRTDFSPSTREGVLAVDWFTPEAACRSVTHRSLRPLMRSVTRVLSDY